MGTFIDAFTLMDIDLGNFIAFNFAGILNCKLYFNLTIFFNFIRVKI